MICMTLIGIFIIMANPIFHISKITTQTLLYLFMIVILVVNAVNSFQKKQIVGVVMNLIPVFLALWFLIRLYL